MSMLSKESLTSLLLFMLSFCVIFAVYLFSDPDVPVGSEWEMVIGGGNPFEKEVRIHYKILDNKEGWILYEKTSFAGTTTSSERLHGFDWNRKCIKGC